MNAIDSHVHFWKYDKKRFAWIHKDMKVLQEDHLPEHFSLTQKRNEIDSVIAVAADPSELQTYFLVELAKTHNMIRGIVGWIDLLSERVGTRMEEFSQVPLIRGWRYPLIDMAGDFSENKALLNGLAFLEPHDHTFDLLIQQSQLKYAANLASKLHHQTFILDHCGKPDIKNRKLDEWKEGIHEIAKNSNVYCKLSGLLTETKWKDWSPTEFYPYLDVVFEEFGVDRLMFGSDWPVLLLSGMYVQWKSMVEKYMENFSYDDKEKVLSLNAKKVYRV